MANTAIPVVFTICAIDIVVFIVLFYKWFMTITRVIRITKGAPDLQSVVLLFYLTELCSLCGELAQLRCLYRGEIRVCMVTVL